MKIVSMNLRRTAEGHFRPDTAEPTSPAEAKAYSEAKKKADMVTDIFDRYTAVIPQLKESDNTQSDLNSKAGIVVTHGPKESDSSLLESHALSFDPISNEPERLQTAIEGTVHRYNWGNGHDRLFCDHQENVNYTGGPLLDFSVDSTTREMDKPSRFHTITHSLKETANGLFVYEMKDEGVSFA